VGEADPDAALQPGQVEAMQGLAEFQEHIVGDVHHGADGAQARAAEALAHPEGRLGAWVNGADDAAGVARAGLRGQEFHGEAIVMAWRDRGGDGGDAHRATVDDAHLARHAGEAQAVAAVRGQV
jgi:hypothetical protein